MKPGLKNITQDSLRLLLRPPVAADVIREDLYSSSSLMEDIQKAANSKERMTHREIFNILIKYFHAYIHPRSITCRPTLKDISASFNAFIHRRVGSQVLWGQNKLRKLLLKYGFALAMLADLPKSAHIFRQIVSLEIDPEDFEGRFVGVDIGAGTGILMLAQWISASRNNFELIEITGIERDPATHQRTALIAEKLNLGKMINSEAKSVQTYLFLKNRPVTFISNETLPGASARLWKEDFIQINKTLFDNFGHLLQKTFFFPGRVLASDSTGKYSTILSRENCFYNVNGPPLHLMFPKAIELDGKLCPLTEIGRDMAGCLNKPWFDILSRRW